MCSNLGKSSKLVHIVNHYIVGSPCDGETEKEARQDDATQTREAAPLPPMQSAHLPVHSSRTGTTTQLDVRRVGHTHLTRKQTESLETRYKITPARSGTMAGSQVTNGRNQQVKKGICTYDGA